MATKNQTEKQLAALRELIAKTPNISQKAIIDKIDAVLPKSQQWAPVSQFETDWKNRHIEWTAALFPDTNAEKKQAQKTADVLWPDSIYAQQKAVSDKLSWMDKNPTPKKSKALKTLWVMNPTRENARDTAAMNVANPNVKQVPEWIDIDEEANKEYQAEKIRENYMNDMKKREQKEYWKHIPEKLKLIQDMADSISDEEKILLDQFLEELIESYYMQKIEEKKNSGLYV